MSGGIRILAEIAFVLLQCTRLTDRQTDGRTDRMLIAIPRPHSCSAGKNYPVLSSIANL